MKRNYWGIKILLYLVALFATMSLTTTVAFAADADLPMAAAGAPDLLASSAGNEVSQYVTVNENVVTINGYVSVTERADGNALIFTDVNGAATTCPIPNDGAISIVEGGSAAELSLDIIDGRKLTSLEIIVSTVTTSVGDTADETIQLPNADITIQAQRVELESAVHTLLNAKSVSVTMDHSGTFSGAELVLSKLAAKRLTASFCNFDIVASGDFNLEAQVEESRIAEETSQIPWGDEAEEMLDVLDGSTKYCASVRPIYITIPVCSSNITAENITINANTEILMNTKSSTVPAAANIAVLHSKITVSGDSVLTATNGDVTLTAANTVESTVAAEAEESLSFAIAAAIVDQMTQVVVTDSAKLSATGNVTVQAQGDINATANACGSEDSQNKSGVYTTVTVVNQHTLAQVGENASVEAGGNLDVSAKETTNATTTATSGAAEEDEPQEGDKDDAKKLTVSSILKFLLNLTVEDENGNEKPAVSESDAEKVSEKLDEAAESATEEDKLEKTEKEEKTQQAQPAKTVKLTVKNDADAVVSGIKIELSVEGKDPITATTDKDGVAMFENVEPGEYTVKFTDGIPGGYRTPDEMKLTLEKDKGYEGEYKLQKKASQSQLVGALGVVVGNSSANALINTTGTVTAAGQLTISADGTAVYETNANASANSAESNSVGAGLVVQVVDTDRNAFLSGSNVTAEAMNIVATNGSEEKTSNSSAKAEAGFSEGKFGLAGAISVNVTVMQTTAKVENAALSVGDIVLKAEDFSNTATIANAAGPENSEGETTGVGAGIALGITGNTVEATLGETATFTEETIGNITVTGASSGNTEVTAKAGAAGGTSVAPVVALDVTTVTV
ncbi:MAG: hypothetical protein J6Q54_07520, partial [Oscillospiraceae bacterium]|nr:hypothetical protein [Oscillospiraceae bacterium]